MKFRSARIEPAEDGKFIVEVSAQGDKGEWLDSAEKRYIADTIEDVSGILKEGIAAVSKPDKKKSSRVPNKDMKMFAE